MQYERKDAQNKIINFQPTTCKNMNNVQETVINEKSVLDKKNLRSQEISMDEEREKRLFTNEVNNDSICNIDSENTNRYNKLNNFLLRQEKL